MESYAGFNSTPDERLQLDYNSTWILLQWRKTKIMLPILHHKNHSKGDTSKI